MIAYLKPRPQPQRILEEIRFEVLAIEQKVDGLLDELLGQRKLK